MIECRVRKSASCYLFKLCYDMTLHNSFLFFSNTFSFFLCSDEGLTFETLAQQLFTVFNIPTSTFT